jgi:UDP-N-acetylmuramoyl-tripeptide--D-alanyl-D-alanine ligase
MNSFLNESPIPYTLSDLHRDLATLLLDPAEPFYDPQIVNRDLLGKEVIECFACDSRACREGSCFFALPGARTHGSRYLGEAFARGAIVAITTDDLILGPELEGYIIYRVPDPLEILQKLAHLKLSRSKTQVLAVTGSLGKTTTTHFLKQLMGDKADGTSGNQNTQISLPLTLLNNPLKAPYLILEMGMTHRGNIANLVQIAPPTAALITTISISHGQNFSSQEEIAKAKSEIFSSPKTKRGVIAQGIVGEEMMMEIGGFPKASFAIGSDRSEVKGTYFGLYSKAEEGRALTLFERGVEVATVLVHFIGVHNLHNLMGAIALLREAGISWDELLPVVPNLHLPGQRMEYHQIGGIHLLDDAYNASSPVAVIAAIDALLEAKDSASFKNSGRAFIALSQMRELGQWEEKAHQEVLEKIIDSCDGFFAYGSYWKKFLNSHLLPTNFYFEVFEEKEALHRAVRDHLQPGDHLLIKGSRLAGMDSLIQALGERAAVDLQSI